MHRIYLNKNWLLDFNVDTFVAWLDEHNIGDDDWDFSTVLGDSSAYIEFENAHDAIAFRLKFGL